MGAAPDGSCIVVATSQGIAVMDKDGTLEWERPHVNRWLASGIEAVAAAPDCRWLAVAGTSGYRYVWLMNHDGRAYAHLGSANATPTALAINHSGSRLAVGTANKRLLLVNSSGALYKTIDFGLGVDGLEYSPDDTLLLTTNTLLEAGLLSAEGRPLWTRALGAWNSVYRNDDWSRFMVVGLPGHGSDVGRLELVTREGKTVWQRTVAAPRVQLAADGKGFVVSAGYEPDDPNDRASGYLSPTVINSAGHESPAAHQEYP